MTVEIQLTSAQVDATIFDLYSNVDGFIVPFETNLAVATLTSPYQTSLVPDNTTIIRVQSVSPLCVNFIDILLTTTTTTTSSTTTTTTTINTVSCNATTNSGGVGVTEYTIPLSSLGGSIIIDFDAFGVPDKLEIIHNGIRKATTSMTGPNEGPFDVLYGDPTVPSSAQATATTQFIGSSKGVIPNRHATFLSETGINTITGTKQQLVWWVYTPTDYTANSNVTLRVTGPTGTGWNLDRLCEPEILDSDIIFNTDDTPTQLKQYNSSTQISTDLFTAADAGTDVAHTSTKLWVYGAVTEIEEYDITLLPFTYTLNRTLTNVKDGDGMCAIDNTTLITMDGEDVYETDITATVVVNTFKWSIMSGRVVTGDFVYTTGAKLIVLNDDGVGNYYISQYVYATGVLDFDLDITATTTTANGLFEYNNVIHIVSSSGTVHSIGSGAPYTITLVDSLAYTIKGASQLAAQATEEFVSNTTTTTSSSTTTTTTTSGPVLQIGNISSTSHVSDACAETLNTAIWIDTQNNDVVTLGDIIYTDSGGTTEFVGDTNYYRIEITAGTGTSSATVSAVGVVGGTINLC